jgi:hypothetical protein
MILTLVIAGFALLGAGTYRQSELVFGHVPRLRMRLGLLYGGYAVLALSLILVIAGPDVPRQLVQWFGLLSVGALVMLIGFWLRSAYQARAESAGRVRTPRRPEAAPAYASEKPKGVLVRR